MSFGDLRQRCVCLLCAGPFDHDDIYAMSGLRVWLQTAGNIQRVPGDVWNEFNLRLSERIHSLL